MSAQRQKIEPLFISFFTLFLIIFILKKPDVLVDVLMKYVHSYCHALICGYIRNRLDSSGFANLIIDYKEC